VKNGDSIRKAIIERLDELLKANEELNRTVKKLSDEKNELQKRLGEKETETESLRKALKLKEQEAQTLQLNAEALGRKTRDLEDKLSKAEKLDKTGELEKRLEDREREADDLRKALRLREEELQGLRLDAQGLRKRLDELQQQPSSPPEAEKKPTTVQEPQPPPTRVTELRREPWFIKCDKCGALRSLEFTAEEVSKLLGNGFMMVECANPNCMDQRGRHNIKVQLTSLL